MAFATFHRGKQLCYDGDLKEGLTLIEEALRRRPKEILFLSFKAQFLYQNRKYKDALSCAENVMRVKSKDVKANHVCYESALKIGDLDKCQQALSKMTKCRARMAKKLMKITEKTKSLEEYTARRERVAEHLREKNSEQAIVEAEKCLLRGKYDCKVLRYKIEALILQNRFDDGIKTFESVLPVATEMIAFHLLAEVTGICYFLKNQLHEAIGVFRTYSDSKNLDLASILSGVLEFQTAAEASLSNDSPEECVRHVEKALAELHRFPVRNDSLERTLNKLKREADLKSRTYPSAVSKALLEVDEHMASRNYEAAHIAISQLVQWARANPNQLPSEFSLVQWERKLEDVKEATRISVLSSTLWSRTRALAALRSTEISHYSKAKVEGRYKFMASRYHPDKHSTESPEWKRMYNILMQEVIEAKKYLLKSVTQTGQEVVTGMKRGGTFSFNEEQRNYNEQVKRRRQETVPGNIS